MPYTIELMSIGEDIYPLLQRSADDLNRVQDQFIFRLVPADQRLPGLQFSRSKYTTSEIWDFLRQQRTQWGGHRPLASADYSNLFGSHEGKEGLAVVTIQRKLRSMYEKRAVFVLTI